MSKSYTVYCHTSPSGKKYVGITGNEPNKRWASGAGYKKNPIFYKAIQKYGWDNIIHEILETNLTKEEAIDKEIYYISLFKANKKEYGYNATCGGEGCNGAPRSDVTKEKLRAKCSGWHHSDLAKQKISQRAKEMWQDEAFRQKNIKRGKDHWNYGKKRSPETIAKIIESKKGYRHTDEWKDWARAYFSAEGNPNYGRKFGTTRISG